MIPCWKMWSEINPYIKGHLINQKVDTWLSNHVKGGESKPFFLWTHYMDVHEPYVPDETYLDRIDTAVDLTSQQMFQLFKDVVVPRDTSDPGRTELLRKLYCAHVSEIDAYAREFFGILEKYGVLKDSVVIVTTDHGDEFGEHGGLSHDGKMYEELVHVPLLIYNAGQAECDTLVSGIDISPTILHILDLKKEKAYQGQSLLPIDSYEEKGVFGEAIGKLKHRIQPTDKPAYYYLNNTLKIIYREEEDLWELYDLNQDPEEKHNIIHTSPLAEEYKSVLRVRINRETEATRKEMTLPEIHLSEQRVKELKQKIEKGKEIYKMAFDRFEPKDMRIVWSGGKDSTLMLWIGLQFCKENTLEVPTCFTIDEFDVFEEIDAMLKVWAERWDIKLDWGLNLDVVRAAGWKLNNDILIKDLNERNQQEIARIGFGDLERFPFEAESFIGNHLMKSVVMNTYLEDHQVKTFFQGLRWDEQAARRNDPYFEDASGDEFSPPHTRYRPILHFTERDIWDATLYFDIPYCPLYEQGYRSLGAKTTSSKTSDVPAWEQDLENTVERAGRRQDKEKAMERLRQLGYM